MDWRSGVHVPRLTVQYRWNTQLRNEYLLCSECLGQAVRQPVRLAYSRHRSATKILVSLIRESRLLPTPGGRGSDCRDTVTTIGVACMTVGPRGIKRRVQDYFPAGGGSALRTTCWSWRTEGSLPRSSAGSEGCNWYSATPIGLALLRRANSTSRLSFSAHRMMPMDGASSGARSLSLSRLR